MLLGFVLLIAAGLCQGSFGLGYKKYSPFSWAAFWGIYCLLCIAVSSIFAWAAAPKLFSVLREINLTVPILCGVLWGLSAVGFSKAIDKIGMSMVYGISMGVSTVVGSVLPMIMGGVFPTGSSAVRFLLGLGLTVAGVSVITAAGIIRDGGFGSSAVGISLAILSGLGSGAMNVGFSYSAGIETALSEMNYSYAAVSAGKWLPVLGGGCFAGILWCAAEVSIKKEWRTVTKKGSLKRTIILLGVSIVWYAALLLYGLSVQIMGSMGGAVCWVLFNALALGVSVGWGLKTGEWRNGKRNILYIGCALLLLAWIVISSV
ncbi:MAG: L-rhamnose/proton symporter RhaT [Clostridia bacterium]